ncbi:YncE family protein [Legionella pneumophila serogroup 10]
MTTKEMILLNKKIGLGVLLGVMASIACAGKPLWTLDPLTATTIEISPTGTATVQYLVTNQSRKSHTLAMLPIQGVTQITSGSGVCANPFVLPTKGSSCILSLQINGAQLTKPINDGPFVCQGGNPNQCYRPSDGDVLKITPFSSFNFAYIANDFSSGANNVTRCAIAANGDFTDCTIAGTGFNNPYGLVFNADYSRVYVTNAFSNNVRKCDLAANGDLVNCSNSGTNLNGPASITFNPAGTRVYVTNQLDNNVTKCDIAANGNLLNCSGSGANMNGPDGITFNPTGTRIYVSNYITHNITKCDLAANGNLTGCSNSGANMNTPSGVTFNAAGTRIYVVNGTSPGSVTKCDLNGSGDLINCTPAGTTGNASRFLAFNADETLAYVTNAGDDNVSKCQVNAAGNLVNCAVTGSNMNGATGMQLIRR